MKNQLITFLCVFIYVTGFSKTTLHVTYSVDKEGTFLLEFIEDEFMENYYEKFSEPITERGELVIELDINAVRYYQIAFDGQYSSIILELEPDKEYHYKYIFKNKRGALMPVEGKEDKNTQLNDYERSYNDFILSYIKPRGKGISKKVLKDVSGFNAQAKAKYGELTPAMVYVDKYNQFMLALKLEKYKKALQVGEDVVTGKELDFKNPLLNRFLRYYLDIDWLYHDFKRDPAPSYWDVTDRQTLDKYLFGYELYENKNVEVLSKLIRLKNIFNEKKYSNVNDLLACADSIAYTPDIDMEVRFTAFRLHKKIHDFYSNRTAPDFTLVDGNGIAHSLTDYRGKPVVLDFWATWCKPCVQAMPELAKVYEQYKDRVHFISISSDDKVEKMNAFVEEKGYNWTFLFAGKASKIKSDYEAYAIPRLVLIDAEGNVVDFDVDYPHELPAMIDKLLNE